MVKMNKETEYEKDLNELKEQILKEGNTLVSKRDLLERFCEIDKEYDGSSWNLLQILANINILIGKEPCEDYISREAVLAMSDYIGEAPTYSNPYAKLEEVVRVEDIKSLPLVQPKLKPKTKRCKWIRYDYRTVCPQNHDVNNPFWRIPENRMDTLKYCPYCGREIEVTE